MFWVFLIGYLTAATGLFIGAAIALLLNGDNQRLKGVMMSFTGGILISFICFEILANALNISGLYIGIIGTLAGALITVFFESKMKKRGNWITILMCAAIVFHSLPEGIVLGAVLGSSISAGITFAIVLVIHCIPEGIATAAYLRQVNLNNDKIIIGVFILALPMAIGAYIGKALNSVPSYVFSICLSFAAGVMLYITCGEILPESKSNVGTIITVMAATTGFLLGSLIIGSL